MHQDLIDTMRSITETTSQDYDHAVRSVYANAHGIVKGQLTIPDDLPPELAQGLFVHQLVMRFSTNPGEIVDNSVSTPRGLGLNILDVDGDHRPKRMARPRRILRCSILPPSSGPEPTRSTAPFKPLSLRT